MYNVKLAVAVLFLCIHLAFLANAQVTVTDGQTALQLVQKLAGPGVSVSNATLVCENEANGIFLTTSSNLGVGEGIVLTSGSSTEAVGLASYFASEGHFTAGDADLDALIAPTTTNDACILEFDFVPLGDTVKFRYVFGSEEYTSFSCTDYNDAFAFFISGPGFTNPENIALIPGTSIPVAINSTSGVPPTNLNDTVKCQSMGPGSPFSQYYVDNIGGTTIAYNGFTQVLTAMAVVVPCSTYHLKLAIADADDYSYDSGVFIEAGSFTSNDLTLSTTANLQQPVPYCVRGCKNGIITFQRQKVTNLPLTVKYQIAGDATNGVDYSFIADSVVIAANDSISTQTIVPLTTATGTKTVKLLVYSPYSCSTSPIILDSAAIVIYDSIYATIATPDTSICPGSSLTLATVMDTALRFKWAPVSGMDDTNSRTPTITASANITCYLTASLPSSTCADVHDAINLSMAQAPNITAQPTGVSGCTGTNVIIPVTATGDDLSYKWQRRSGTTFSDLTNGPDYTGVNNDTLTLNNVNAGWDGYEYRCIISGKCLPNDTTAPVIFNIATEPNIIASPVNDSICQGTDALFIIHATGTNLTYQWQISYGFGFSDLINTGPYNGAFDDSLSISAVPASMDGHIFRCIVNGLCPPKDTSSDAKLVVHKLPKVITEPASISVCPDQPSAFTLNAEAGNIVYQWQVDTGSGFISLLDNSLYAGSNTNSLQITQSSPGMTGYVYRCIVSGACLPNDTSVNAVLTVDTIPAISAQPINSVVCEGDTAIFALQAYGSGTLAYQWQVKNGNGYTDLTDNAQYAGTITNTLRVFSTTVSLDSTEYRCIVQGNCDGDTSDLVVLTVKELPAITNHPGNAIVCEGDAATFTVAATGSDLSYQWQVKNGTTFVNLTDNTIYNGTASDTLKLNATTAGMNNLQYRCVVSGYCLPKDTSATALLTVRVRPNITAQAKDSIVCDGAAVSFRISAVGTGIGYQWQEDTGNGFINIINNTLYSGATTRTLRLSSSTVSMDGYRYRCLVSGLCQPIDTSDPATLYVRELPDIVSNPTDTTVCDGNSASFTMSAIGTGATYRWQVDNGAGFTNISDGSLYSGTSAPTLVISHCDRAMDSFIYRCIVSGACNPPDTTLVAMLYVLDLPEITQDVSGSTVCDGQATTFTITATGTDISYQWQENDGSGFNDIVDGALYSGANSNTLNVASTGMPMNGYQYRCIVNGICTPPDTSSGALLTVRELPNIAMQPTDSTICEYSSASFSINATGTTITYQWQLNDGSGFANINNSVTYSGTTSSVLNINAATAIMDGYLYRCIVTGVCAPADTSIAATLSVSTPPAINVIPHATQICEGGDAAFTVTATGTNLHYQWQVNDGNGYINIIDNTLYSGANTNSLYITGVTSAMSGYLYQCIVSGDCPPAVTSGALTLMLTVYTKPSVTAQASDKRICAGANTHFTVKGAGTGIAYQWQVDAGNGFVNIVDNTLYTGATSDSLNIFAAPKHLSGNRYRCVVVGVCLPDAISDPITLTVDTLASILIQPVDSTVCDQMSVSFVTMAEGTARSYQWQEDAGQGFADIPGSSSIYTGTNTETLSIPVATIQMQGYKYRCIVSAICNSYDTTDAVSLSLDTIPVISVSPLPVTICEGDTTFFNIHAIGTDVQYQWQINDGSGYVDLANSTLYSGATNDTLLIAGASSTMTGYAYRCIVSGTCAPADTSADALLTVNTRPNIIVQAKDTIICEGEDVVFEISATGTGITYQWLVDEGSGWMPVLNNTRYSGATTPKLEITNTSYAMNGWLYSCAVSGICTPVDTAQPVLLTVNQLVSVIVEPVSSTICDGDITAFQLAAIGTGISYQWQVNDGSGYQDIINNVTYSGATTNTLNLSAVNTSFNGLYYRCIVSGTCAPNDTSAEVLLTVNSLPVITVQAKDTTVCEGVDAAFAITATGTGITYQWQEDGGAGFSDLSDNTTYSGSTTNTLNIATPAATLNSYKYRCVVSGICTPADTSSEYILTVYTSPNIIVQPEDTIICVTNPAQFAIVSNGSILSYQWQIDTGSGYVDITNTVDYNGINTNILTVISVTTNMHADKFRCVVTGACTPADTSNEAMLSVFTPPVVSRQPVDVKVCAGESPDFNIRASGSRLTYQWQVNAGSGFIDITNGGMHTGANTNRLNLNSVTTAEDGYKYRCIVSGYCAPADTSAEATLGVRVMPVADIAANGPLIFCSGDSVLLQGQPTTDVSYRWFHNNELISKEGSYTAKAPGIYKLYVATQYCTSSPDSLDIIVNPLPDAGIVINSRPVICQDSFVLLNASNPSQATYLWHKDGEAMADGSNYYYYAYEKGLYDLLVTNNYGCSLRSIPQYLDADELPYPEIATENLMMCTKQLAEHYQWYWNGSLLTGEINDCHLAAHNGYYKLYITNLNGCPKWSNQISIDKVAEVWPNPTTGVLNIMADEAAYIEISNAAGKNVFVSVFQPQIDISNVAEGVYMVRLFNKQKELIKAIRIVKKEN